ncbi:MAG: acyl-CoA/acyl-ACP dehydrogenase [Deltaproteobacteria bacterium]|nr:acyl-CoA/acyl-ACP dehydrogenase [Deltaproteobacteria bacterium]
MRSVAFSIPDDVIAVRNGIEAFLRKEVIPRHEEHHELLSNQRLLYRVDGRFCDEALALIRRVRMASADAGYYNMCVPPEIGGAGMGLLAYYVAWECIFRLCGGHHWLGTYVISHWAFGPSRVLLEVSPKAREEMLPAMIAGEKSMCFGLSEPGAGSDAAMLQTRATADDGGWRLNGRKIWITNAPYADYALIFAITDPERASRRKGGISAFLIPTDTPGFEIENVIRMYGEIGGNEGEVVLGDVRVEPHQLVGELHEGFRLGVLGVSLGRVYNSARAVGSARWALKRAIEYSKVREVFGNAISKYQGIMFPLAESATEVHAAHLMGLNTTMLLDGGKPAIKELSMMKSYSVEVGARAIDRVIQAHGAIGFTNEMGLTEAWKYLRLVNVADGTNEILRRTILHRMLGGDLD